MKMEVKKIKAFLKTQGIEWNGKCIETQEKGGQFEVAAHDQDVMFLDIVRLKSGEKSEIKQLQVMPSLFWICSVNSDFEVDLSAQWGEFQKNPESIIEEEVKKEVVPVKPKAKSKKKIVKWTISDEEFYQ